LDIKTISDRMEIADLISRYNVAADVDDFDTWVACFVEDGVFNGAFSRYRVRADLDAYKADVARIATNWPNLRHYVTNIQTEIDGDSGRAHSFLLMTSVRPGDAVQNVMSGTYTDQLRRVNGEWRFVSRTVAVDGVKKEGKL